MEQARRARWRSPDIFVRTEYTRYAAKLARKVHGDAARGGAPAPDAEFFGRLAKALDEIAEALETQQQE